MEDTINSASFSLGLPTASAALQEQIDIARERKTMSAQSLDELEAYARTFEPIEPENFEVTPELKQTIAQIESGGRWWAKNPNSSAAGVYQFLEGTWQEIMEEAPELELTENGRVSKNTEQQERAMDWFTKRNMAKLAEAGIELSIENIYAAHFLGAEGAIKVLSADEDALLRTKVSKKVMQANDFDSGMQVGDFKYWVHRKVDSVNQAGKD